MNSRITISALAILTCLCGSRANSVEPAHPNILIILCDDLGYGDLECYGHPHIKTPRLNHLAEEGIRFTSFYSAAPVCSPSRVGLLTGRTPNRAGVYDWIPDADPDQPPKRSRDFVHLRKEEFTIPRMLKESGYATCLTGKWHCNAMFNSDKQAQPGDHGFDHWFATQNNAHPSHENPVNFVRNGTPVGEMEGYSCQIVSDEACGWIENQVKNHPDQPFFAYVAFHEPHEPVASPPDLVEKYEKNGARNNDEAQFFANVENVDLAAGKLLDKLEELEVADDTLVIFTSDNGPETLDRYPRATRSYGRPGPLRGMKLWTTEAGYRVAGIMRWPGHIEPGQVSDRPVCTLDFLPTFAELAGGSIPATLELDGANFLPALEDKPIGRQQPLIWIYYNAINEAKVAMRKGDWKILGSLNGGEFPKIDQVDESNIDDLRAASLDKFEVYNVRTDIDESEPRAPGVQQLQGYFLQVYGKVMRDQHVWPAVAKPAAKKSE